MNTSEDKHNDDVFNLLDISPQILKPNPQGAQYVEIKQNMCE